MTSFVIIIISVNFQLKQLSAKFLPLTISYSCCSYIFFDATLVQLRSLHPQAIQHISEVAEPLHFLNKDQASPALSPSPPQLHLHLTGACLTLRDRAFTQESQIRAHPTPLPSRAYQSTSYAPSLKSLRSEHILRPFHQEPIRAPPTPLP